MPFPSHNLDLTMITLTDWYESNMNSTKADGIVTKSDEIMDAQIQSQRAPHFFDKMKQNMTSIQIFDVKLKMYNKFSKDNR